MLRMTNSCAYYHRSKSYKPTLIAIDTLMVKGWKKLSFILRIENSQVQSLCEKIKI